jgi:mutator protein MutT
VAGPSGDRVRVVAAVIRRDDALLVCRRPAHKQHGGLWEFPGGKCEVGETDDDAMSRELHEELGVRVRDVGAPMLTVADPGSRFDIVFIPTVIEGDPQPLEHTALCWGTPAELATLALAPSDAAFVTHLMRRPTASPARSAPHGRSSPS